MQATEKTGLDPQNGDEETDIAYAPLSIDTDAFDGLSQDVWYALVDIRDRKIQSESELRQASAKLAEIQGLYTSTVDQHESTRKELDRMLLDLSNFYERRFLNLYNLEALIELKQGQVGPYIRNLCKHIPERNVVPLG
jgi:hypothetical protein